MRLRHHDQLTALIHASFEADGGCVHFDHGFGPFARCEDPDEGVPIRDLPGIFAALATPTDSLEEAWAAAEAVLPEDAFIRVGRALMVDSMTPPRPQDITQHFEARAHIWDATAYGYSAYVSAEADTPAAALRALAAKLTEAARLDAPRHPYTCGVCSWGRDGVYHDLDEYLRHMAATHPANS